MLFNSSVFFIFFAIFFVLYFLTHKNMRLWLILVASYVFYGWWNWRYVFLVAATTLVDYAVGRLLSKTDDPKRRKWLLGASLFTNLGVLGFFKYFNFFIESFAQLISAFGMQPHLTTLRIILPVGISFYTFQTMSYTIDVYKRKIEAEPSLLRFAAFVAFFPQLLAGPIVRASSVLPQMREDHNFQWDNFYRGLTWVIWGYFLKVGLADSIALVVDITYAHPEQFTSSALLVSTFFYTFQVYGDFAGYSGIAIGVARILGFDFGVNFFKPYFATSMNGFWKRWHISFSSWLRDYVYIPLGGSRHGKLKTYRNSFLTMLVCGFWHGAGFNFILWGGLHGCYLVGMNIVKKPYGKFMEWIRCPKLLRSGLAMFYVFTLACLTRVFFRERVFHESLVIFHKIFTLEDFSIASIKYKLHVVKGLFLIAFLILVDAIDEKHDFLNQLYKRPWLFVAFNTLVLVLIFLFGNFFANAFIYFAF